MKNKFFGLLLLIVLLLIIAVTVFCFRNNIFKKKTTSYINDNVVIEEKDLVFTETGERFGFRANIGIKNKYVEYTSGDYTSEQYKTINGTKYSNINRVLQPNPVKKTYEKAELNGGAIILSNVAEFKNGLFFDNDVELLPRVVYLEKERDLLYPYNGIYYFIPVIQCPKEEERIEYRNGLTIMKNTGNIIFNDNIIAFNYDDYYSKIDLENIFNCYFISQPNNDLVYYKMYNVTNLTNCISIVIYNGGPSRVLLRGNENETVDMCYIPMNIAGNVGNYYNLFYQNLGLTNVNSDQDHKYRLLLLQEDSFIILEND